MHAEKNRKNYDVQEDMQYAISSIYFLTEGDMGYELVIAQAEQEGVCGRKVKIFVYKKDEDKFSLQQVLVNKNHTGAARDGEGKKCKQMACFTKRVEIE